MPDFEALDRYLAARYPPPRRVAAVAAKSLLPIGLLARRAVTCDAADVLLLHPHAAARARHEPLALALRDRGLKVRDEVLPNGAELLRLRKLYTPPQGWHAVPRRWRAQAGYAAWIVATHRPRVLATFMDDSVHSPFLRAVQHSHGGVAVNVAHAAVWPNMDFSMCDFDWLLLWGERSLASLRAAPVRFGGCRALLVGSIYLRGAPLAAPASAADRLRILWIGQNIGSVHRRSLESDARVFARCVAALDGAEVTMRAHPLDRGELHRLMAPLLPRAQWSDASRPLAEALREADVAVASFSSGLLEAAALGVPLVAMGATRLAEPLGLHDHALPMAHDEAQLRAALQDIRSRPGDYRARALALAREHFAAPGDATRRCADVIALLARGGDPASLGLAAHAIEGR